MMNVISIERARGFGVRSQPYSGFLMMTSTSQSGDLLLINLPLHSDVGPTPVLVQIRSVTASGETSVVLIDSDQTGRVTRSFMGLASSNGPYKTQQIGPITQFMNHNADQVSSLIAAGAVEHSNLTIARAVLLMQQQELGAADALAQALQIEQSILAMHARHSQLVQAVLT